MANITRETDGPFFGGGKGVIIPVGSRGLINHNLRRRPRAGQEVSHRCRSRAIWRKKSESSGASSRQRRRKSLPRPLVRTSRTQRARRFLHAIPRLALKGGL